jgi:hypothetical protein
MPLEDFILIVFCWIDDQLSEIVGERRLRQRGLTPKLSDSEVITMEVVGEFLGHDTDVAIWRYFSQHWHAWFPGLGSRTTFVQQAANLWAVKQVLHQHLARQLGARSDSIHLLDGFPMPVCVITRAPRCRVFAGSVDHGYCAAKQEYYYGFHGHLLISWAGVITGVTVTPASGDERQALWDLMPGLFGLLIGDKGYLGAFLRGELAQVGIDLQTPLRVNMADPRDPHAVRQLMRTRRHVETVIGQLTERFHIEKVRARDLWHLTSRMARKILAHTLGIFVNRWLGRPDLQFDGLLTT